MNENDFVKALVEQFFGPVGFRLLFIWIPADTDGNVISKDHVGVCEPRSTVLTYPSREVAEDAILRILGDDVTCSRFSIIKLY